MNRSQHVLLAALAVAAQGLALQVPSSGALDPAGKEMYPSYSDDAESNVMRNPQRSSIASFAVFSDGEADSVPNYMSANDESYDGNLVDKVTVEVSYDGRMGNEVEAAKYAEAKAKPWQPSMQR
jgi:hypothetical protein